MLPSLDTLMLTPQELKLARKKVQELAHQKWQQAGSPDGGDVDFWLEAEAEWIKYYYVPDRQQRYSDVD